MPTYTGDFSNRKMKAVQAMVAEIKKIEILKKKGGKKLLAQYGYKGNQPKMALRGLRSFLLSEDNLFADLLEQYESGKRTPYKLAEGVRQRTEKIGKSEVIIHSDTIHHPEPLELGDGLLEMELYAEQIFDEIGVNVHIIGFDSGVGLPRSDDYRDQLYFWREGDFKQDQNALDKKLTKSKIFYGEVGEKVISFLEKKLYPPIGFISFDLDFLAQLNIIIHTHTCYTFMIITFIILKRFNHR